MPGPDRSASSDHDRLIGAAALATAAAGAARQDSNAASAMVNTSQQVGGPIGTALPDARSGTDRPCWAELANAGGGLSLGIVQVSAIIPGFLPALILTVSLVAVVVVPLMALGLLVALLAAPPYGLWRLAARHRQRRPTTPSRASRRCRRCVRPSCR